MTPHAAKIISSGRADSRRQGLHDDQPDLERDARPVAKQGLTPYPMIDNVTQGDVVNVAGQNQLDAAFGGDASALSALKSMQSTLNGLPSNQRGQRLHVGHRAAASPAGRARGACPHECAAHATIAPPGGGGPPAARAPPAPGRAPVHAAGDGARRLAAARPDRADLLLQLHATGTASEPAQWIGVSAYRRLFANPEFISVIENNGLIMLAIPVAVVLPLGGRVPDQHATSGAGASSARCSSCPPRSRGS